MDRGNTAHNSQLSSLSQGGIGRSLLFSATLLLLPLIFFVAQITIEKREEITRLEHHLTMLDWVSPLYDALNLSTQYRGLREISAQYPGHYPFAEEHQRSLQQLLDLQLQQLGKMHNQLPDEHFQKAGIGQSIELITDTWQEQQGEQFSFQMMSDVVTHLNQLILNLLPEQNNMETILLQDILELREAIARLRGTGSGLLAYAAANNTKLNPNNLIEQIINQLEHGLWESESRFVQLRDALGKDREILDEQLISLMTELVGEIQELRDLVRWELIDTATVDYQPEEFFKEGTDPIELLHLLSMEIRERAKITITRQIGERRQHTFQMLSLVGGTLLIAVLLAFRSTIRVVRGVQQAVYLLQRIGHGDFHHPVPIRTGKGEIGLLLESIQQTQHRLNLSYQELVSAQQFSESLTSSMEEGVYALDSQGHLIFMNQAAERILGWQFEELKSRNIHEVVHAHSNENTAIPTDQCPIHLKASRGGSHHSDDEWFRHKDGTLIPIEFTAAPLRIAKRERLIGSVAVFRDISGRLVLEEQLRTAAEEAATANRAKDEFLTSMSHELRTPLSVIIGNCELLEERETVQEKQLMVKAISSSGRRLLALINDILDLSKIEAGMFSIHEVPYDLDHLIDEIEQMFETQMRDAGLQFVVERKIPLCHLLIGDVQRVGQILINLVGNALKFTDSGSVHFAVECSEERLIFKIEDSGIGMSDEALQRLFRRFEQADQAIARRFGGSGLGLYISYCLAQQMGGTIEVESELDQGSLFRVELPYRLSDQKRAQTEQEQKGSVIEYQLEGSVLIAEDSPEMQQIERKMVTAIGPSVTFANNGKEAVALSRKQAFDLILMDMQMPEMDGIEASQTIRAHGNYPPIIAVTANVMPSDRERFLQAGCNDFMGKPINRTDLERMLAKYLRKSDRPLCVDDDQNDSLSDFDETFDDDLIDDEMLQLFIEMMEERRALIEQSIQEHDWKQIGAIAHMIKGTAAAYGFPQLAEVARQIDQEMKSGVTTPSPTYIQQLLQALEEVILQQR